MAYVVTQNDIELVQQHKRIQYARIELLNKNFQTIEELDGDLQNDDYSIDADSDVRRRYNISLVVKNSTFSIGRDRKIWLDKYVKLSIGIYHNKIKAIQWYPVGIYILDSANYTFNATSKLLSLPCSDRTAELNGERNGQISGMSTLIPANTTSIREAMISTVTQLGGISKYRVEDVGEMVPYDLSFNVSCNVWDIVTALRDLYPGWEAFFDDDVFVFQPIPSYENYPVLLDADLLDQFVISDNTTYNFSNVKNVTELWGKTLESDFYLPDSNMDANGVYNLSNSTISELSSGLKIAFTADKNSLDNSKIKVNSFGVYEILVSDNEPIAKDKMKSGKSYVLRYSNVGNGAFYYLGEYQICAVTKLVSRYPSLNKIKFDLENEPTTNISYIVNPDSPYCSDFNDVGEIRQVLSGGELDNIYSEDLARQRAEYENWKTTDLLESITLEMIDIPWIDVNQKIEYRSKVTNEINQYVIKSKRGSSMSGVMTLSCVKYQSLYPWQL